MRRTLLRIVLGAALLGPGLVLALVSRAGQAPSREERREKREGAGSDCGCAHACQAVSYQGCGCGSISCFPGGSRWKDLTVDTVSLRILEELREPAPCLDGMAEGRFPCLGVNLVSFVPLPALLPGAVTAGSLWGFVDADDGREYAVHGVRTGTSVVDVTDATNPIVVGAIPGLESRWREVKVYQFWNPSENRHNAYAYVVTEANSAGLQIINLSELPLRISLAATDRDYDTAHTVTLSNVDLATGLPNAGSLRPILYLQGPRRGGDSMGVAALDVSNPTDPVPLGLYNQTYGHDSWTGIFTGERAAACAPGHDPCEIVVVWTGMAARPELPPQIRGGVRILDWTEKAAPQVLSELIYPNLRFAHSGWISRDENYLFSMDEGIGGVRVLDIRDLARPRLVASWIGPTPAIEHNAYTVGDKLYIAHYERGLTVLDVSNPTAPAEIALFDTYPESNNPFTRGVWGIYPYLLSGNILVGNIDGAAGLFVLREASLPPLSAPRQHPERLPPRNRTPRSATPR